MLNADMANNLIIKIPRQHLTCHLCILLGFFCYWVNGNDQNRIDFLISGTELGAKSV